MLCTRFLDVFTYYQWTILVEANAKQILKGFDSGRGSTLCLPLIIYTYSLRILCKKHTPIVFFLLINFNIVPLSIFNIPYWYFISIYFIFCITPLYFTGILSLNSTSRVPSLLTLVSRLKRSIELWRTFKFFCKMITLVKYKETIFNNNINQQRFNPLSRVKRINTINISLYRPFK